MTVQLRAFSRLLGQRRVLPLHSKMEEGAEEGAYVAADHDNIVGYFGAYGGDGARTGQRDRVPLWLGSVN